MGILYGAFFQRRFSNIENARREKEERERPAREAKEAAEKKIRLEGNLYLYFQKLIDD